MSTSIVRLAARQLVARKAVACVTLIAIASGVTSLTATQLIYESVVTSYEATALQFTGRAAFQVTNGDVGVPEELVDELQRVQGVRAVAATVEGFVSAPEWPGERLYVYGVDLLADHYIRDYGSTSTAVVPDPLAFLAASDSVALTTEFVAAHDLKLQDRIRVLAPAGVEELTIRAILGMQRGLASVLDGRLAIMDLSAAQILLNFEGRCSHIAIEIASNADLETMAVALNAAVAGRGVVERPQTRAQAFVRLLTNYRFGLLLVASTAMIVALFCVFNASTIAVVQRRTELAMLRTLGMRRREVVVLVAGEILILALAGGGMGIIAGLAVARFTAGTFADTVATLYAEIGNPSPQLNVPIVLTALLAGLGTTLLGSAAPLFRAMALHPLEAMRSCIVEREAESTYVAAALSGIALVGCAGALWITRLTLPISVEVAGLLAMLGTVLGLALTVPICVRFFAERSSFVAERMLGPLGFLANRSLERETGRVAITCSAMLVSLAGCVAIATWLASLEGTLSAVFDTVFAQIDLVISSGSDPFSPDATRLPSPLVDDIASLPDVAYVDPMRVSKMGFGGSTVALIAADTRLYVQGRRTLYMIDGDTTTASDLLAQGSAVVVNQTFARRFNHRRGDMLVLATPSGEVRLPIAGVYLELVPGDLGTIHLDRRLYRRLWRDDTASVVQVALKQGVSRPRAIETIRTRWGERHRLVVFTIEEIKRQYERLLAHLTSLVYPLLVAALGIGLVGVVSARLTSVMSRMHELGVLRAVGATKRQIRRMVIIEAGSMGCLAAVLAVAVGSVLGRMQVEILLRGMFGMSVIYAYPYRVVLMTFVTAIIVTSGSGYIPGRMAGRTGVSEALSYE